MAKSACPLPVLNYIYSLIAHIETIKLTFVLYNMLKTCAGILDHQKILSRSYDYNHLESETNHKNENGKSIN